MNSPFIAKLGQGALLTGDDRLKLVQLTAKRRKVGSRQDVIVEGDAPDNVHLVIEGIACRYKVFSGGKRQITALLLPGDFFDLQVAVLGAIDHSIGTITACTMVEIPREAIDKLAEHHPQITRAMRWASLVDECVLREWIVNMGGRFADQQLAHLLCELLVRLKVTGNAEGLSYRLPLTQEDLGDVLGLSVVQVNRSIQKLRTARLIELRAHRLTILDWPELQRLAGFDVKYLHLRPSREVVA